MLAALMKDFCEIYELVNAFTPIKQVYTGNEQKRPIFVKFGRLRPSGVDAVMCD